MDEYDEGPDGPQDDDPGPETDDNHPRGPRARRARDDHPDRDQPPAPRDDLRDRRDREPAPLHFGGEEARDKTGDHRTFVLVDADDEPLTEVLHAYRCKQWMLIKIAQAEGQDQVDLFLDEVMAEESADYLRDRFDDAEDDLDVDHLAPAIEGLVGLWYGRPTGRQPGSSRRRGNPRSGRRSTVRRRS
jgi:hypothetical protein